jgi:hypothetical protein
MVDLLQSTPLQRDTKLLFVFCGAQQMNFDRGIATGSLAMQQARWILSCCYCYAAFLRQRQKDLHKRVL